jgi:hypothetical protein
MAFHMFLLTPPLTVPVNTLYREERAFGPYLEGTIQGFSDGIVIGVAETAMSQYRSLYAFCKGKIRVLGTQNGFSPSDPDSPLVVSLKPLPNEALELERIFNIQFRMEAPIEVLYVGLDPVALKSKLLPIINALPNPSGSSSADRWEAFLKGETLPVVDEGSIIGEVSAYNLKTGFRNFVFMVKTSEKNYLDPVVLYSKLTGTLSSPTELDDSTFAIPENEWYNFPNNTWLEVATTNRVLISFRDEWNEPLISPTETAIVSSGSNQISKSLSVIQGGTIAATDGWDDYVCRINGRVLTRILSDAGAFDSITIGTSAPAHFTISTVRPEDWFSPTTPAYSATHKDKELRHYKGSKVVYYTDGNLVEPLIDGLVAFPKIVEDFRLISTADHFVLIEGWDLNHEFNMIKGDNTSSLRHLLTKSDSRGAIIRSLIWDNIPGNIMNPILGKPLNPDCYNAHKFIEDLTNGESVLDNKTHHSLSSSELSNLLANGEASLLATLAATVLKMQYMGGPGQIFLILNLAAITFALTEIASKARHIGSHHSKFIAIRNSKLSVAYLGGMDIVPNRLDGPDHLEEDPYHDVHCRIVGPAVADIVRTFENRWNDHATNHGRGLSVIPSIPTTPAGTCMVQVARTFGAGTQTYAEEGDRTIWSTLKQALSHARKYVYIEDQYLWYSELSDELDVVLANNDKLQLIIVIDPKDYASWLPDHPRFIPDYPNEYLRGDRARYLFLNPLHTKYPNRVHVFTPHSRSSEIKVHTKAVIIDDIFVTIGSANMGQRSLTHDTETNVFVLDGRVEGGGRKFARDFRIKLWAEHMGIHRTSDLYQRTILGNVDWAIKEITIFSKNSPLSRLRPYDFDLGKGALHVPGWFDYSDPDGRGLPL